MSEAEAEVDPEDLLDQNHDWSPWGRDRWRSWGVAAKCRRQQIRYGALRWRGVSEGESARRSLTNAPKNDHSLKQAAFRLETSKGVRRLMDMVNEQVGKGTGPLGEAEARIILSDLSRGGGDPNRIKAIEALQRLDAAARHREQDQRAQSADEAFLTAVKAAPIFGASCLAEMYFQKHSSLPFGSPQFQRIAPMIAQMHEEVWAGWRAKLPGHEDTMDMLAASELPAEFYDETPADAVVEVDTEEPLLSPLGDPPPEDAPLMPGGNGAAPDA